MQTKNKVASILKAYSIINGIACIILGFILKENLPYAVEDLWIIEVAAGVFISFLIYACGEVIQLLQDIKNNTERTQPVNNNTDDELPEI